MVTLRSLFVVSITVALLVVNFPAGIEAAEVTQLTGFDCETIEGLRVLDSSASGYWKGDAWGQ